MEEQLEFDFGLSHWDLMRKTLEKKNTHLREELNKLSPLQDEIDELDEWLVKNCPHTTVISKTAYFAADGYDDPRYARSEKWNECEYCKAKFHHVYRTDWDRSRWMPVETSKYRP